MVKGVFALTGGIASGKSFVLHEFKKMGFKTIDSDKIVSSLYNDKKIKKNIKKIFNTTNKKKISQIVFSSKTEKKKLESLLHPLVKKIIVNRIKKFKKPVLADIPLIFESKTNFKPLFSHIIVVKSTQKQQVERLKLRGFTKKQALSIIKSQMPLSKKLKKAHFIIDNSKTKTLTKKQIRILAKKMREFL